MDIGKKNINVETWTLNYHYVQNTHTQVFSFSQNGASDSYKLLILEMFMSKRIVIMDAPYLIEVITLRSPCMCDPFLLDTKHSLGFAWVKLPPFDCYAGAPIALDNKHDYQRKAYTGSEGNFPSKHNNKIVAIPLHW